MSVRAGLYRVFYPVDMWQGSVSKPHGLETAYVYFLWIGQRENEKEESFPMGTEGPKTGSSKN